MKDKLLNSSVKGYSQASVNVQVFFRYCGAVWFKAVYSSIVHVFFGISMLYCSHTWSDEISDSDGEISNLKINWDMRIGHLRSGRSRGKTLNLLLYHTCLTACFGSTIRHIKGIYRVVWMSRVRFPETM